LSAVGILSSRKREKFQAGNSSTKESEILNRSLGGFENQVSELGQSNKKLSAQVLPSLKKEIQSGRPTPYTFGCTLVRVDINNFSSIFASHNVEEFIAYIDDFFSSASHVVARYGGLVHEFVGDEIIFYFKDEDTKNTSAAVAISAVRDILELSDRLNKKTSAISGYPFHVKASLAHGPIRFGKLVNGFSIAGGVLIETVRILSVISEKNENVVLFDASLVEAVKDLVEVKGYGDFQLKGMPGSRNLTRYVSHKPLGDALRDIGRSSHPTIGFYRSDSDLLTIIRWCQAAVEQKNYFQAQQAINFLREVQVTTCASEAREFLTHWLGEICGHLQLTITNPKVEELRIFASLIKLIENLTPEVEFGPDIEAMLNRCLQVKDRRVIANSLDVLTKFKSQGDSESTDVVFDRSDNRVAANALLHSAIVQIRPALVRDIKKMLESKDLSQVASAIWAIGEISQFYMKNDQVYLASQLEFSNLQKATAKFSKHSNAMVKRQSLIAISKFGEHFISEVNERPRWFKWAS
jgi:class 3 adenylate cyclase